MTPAYELMMKTGPAPDLVIPLTGAELVIGREAAADILIADADVSRRHSRLTLQGENYTIEDLGSTNGTFVNDQRLGTPQALKPGDHIKLGDQVELIYMVSGVSAEPTILAASPEAFSEPQPEAAAPASLPQPPAFQAAYPAPAEPAAPAPNKTLWWILGGVGCLFLLCICIVVVGVVLYLAIQPAYIR